MFVPGFMQRGDAWEPVAAAVRERYPSACLDHRADTLEARVAEALAAAGDAAVLAGYSLGGRVALRAALERPRAVRALILLGASAGIEDPDERRARRKADERLAAWMDGSSIEQVVERWERQRVLATQPPELVERQRASRLAHDPPALSRLLRSAGQGALEPVWHRLGALTMPVLALAGALDERYVAAGRRIAANVAHGRFEAIAGAGHAAHLERPDAVARAILSFLYGLSR